MNVSFWGASALAVGLVCVGGAFAEESSAANKQGEKFYVGTYTSKTSKGIYLGQLDAATGKISLTGVAAETESPSFLAFHPTRPLLLAANEVGQFAGKPGGAISAFAIDAATGKLTLLSQQSSGGAAPCHVNVDRSGRWALFANYSGGSCGTLPILDDGQLGDNLQLVQHRGSGVDRGRQEAPHAHSINLDAQNRFAFVADLGLDKVMIYRFDVEKGSLTANDPAFAAVAAGSGPRHFAFHPSGRYAYVINEMKSTVTAFRYDPARGSLETIQTISTLPADFRKPTTTAEVQVHPNGKFLYGSNRGHDSITAFAIDAQSGKLRLLGQQSTGGKTPRNFAIDPSGRWVIAANQDSDNLVVLKIDEKRGTLSATGQSIAVSMPVCVKFAPKGP
jgi:6-phosphogluconolactonase